jgi:hypothetical protein
MKICGSFNGYKWLWKKAPAVFLLALLQRKSVLTIEFVRPLMSDAATPTPAAASAGPKAAAKAKASPAARRAKAKAKSSAGRSARVARNRGSAEERTIYSFADFAEKVCESPAVRWGNKLHMGSWQNGGLVRFTPAQCGIDCVRYKDDYGKQVNVQARFLEDDCVSERESINNAMLATMRSQGIVQGEPINTVVFMQGQFRPESDWQKPVTVKLITSSGPKQLTAAKCRELCADGAVNWDAEWDYEIIVRPNIFVSSSGKNAGSLQIKFNLVSIKLMCPAICDEEVSALMAPKPAGSRKRKAKAADDEDEEEDASEEDVTDEAVRADMEAVEAEAS